MKVVDGEPPPPQQRAGARSPERRRRPAPAPAVHRRRLVARARALAADVRRMRQGRPSLLSSVHAVGRGDRRRPSPCSLRGPFTGAPTGSWVRTSIVAQCPSGSGRPVVGLCPAAAEVRRTARARAIDQAREDALAGCGRLALSKVQQVQRRVQARAGTRRKSRERCGALDRLDLDRVAALDRVHAARGGRDDLGSPHPRGTRRTGARVLGLDVDV